MPGVTPRGMEYHHSYGMNGHGGGYGYGPGPRNGYGGPDIDQHSMDRFDRDMEPTIELDHLATYSSKSGVMKPEDGLRKLRGMESTTGIWTMRCMMVIERKNLIVVDKGNGEELERFPLELVHEPTAIFKEDKREVYTNLILFTILEYPGKYNSRCDMHIFQSINVPAQDIVDEILAAKEGRPKLFPSSIPPPPMGPAPDPPEQSSRYHYKTTTMRDEATKSQGDRFRSQNEGFRVIPSEGFRPPVEEFQVQNEAFRSQDSSKDIYATPMREKDSSRGYYGQSQNRASFEPSGGQNETLERDVQFLNSCFDDIEKFVARLQQAAEAYKELENRKRERQSHKKKNDRAPPKDGMLNVRARPPPADDFIDIFQKIKWAFNLLAKLKAHIHDPNAPELVHFIFTPLSLIYEASRDPVHAGVDLASKALSPLLTRDAKELLLNCLTSKELELWQLLGRNWTTSEDEYPGHVETFYPRFYNGWTPAPPSQQMVRQLPTPRDDIPRDDYGRTSYRPEEHSWKSRREEEPSYPSGQIGRSFRPDMDDEQYRRDPTMYEKRRPSTPPPGAVANPNVAKYQEYVEKHIDRNQDAQRYPKSRAQENAEYREDLRRKNAKIYEAVHERTGRNQKEITVEKGDILEVLDDSRNWWRLRNFKGETGYAPYTILRDVGDDRNDIDRNGGQRGSFGGYSGNIGHNQSNHIPIAPPPPRKDEEVFTREIKPSRLEDNHQNRMLPRTNSSDRFIRREDTPDNSDGDNLSGSYDGSMDDTVDRRNNYYRGNDKSNQKSRNRYSGEIRKPDDSGGYNNRSFEEDPQLRQKPRQPPSPPAFNPPPPPVANRPSGGRRFTPPGKVEKKTERDELHNELSQRLSIAKPVVKPKPQHQSLNITTKSTTYEVSEWLRSKSFSQRCINALSGYNGYDILAMKTKAIERLIGHDEAQRLAGHLTLQKNMSGYKTHGPRELEAILQQRKQRADVQRDDGVGRPPSFAPESPDYSDDNSEVQGITDDLDNILSNY